MKLAAAFLAAPIRHWCLCLAPVEWFVLALVFFAVAVAAIRTRKKGNR